MATTLKGQNFRILTVNEGDCTVIGKATSCTVTLGTNTDDASTKDDVGLASKPEITSKNWSVSVESLDVTDIAAILTAINAGTPFTLMWDETGNYNQDPAHAAFARIGTAYMNDVTFSFNDRENSTKSLQFTGASALQKTDSALNPESVVTGGYTKGQTVRLFLGSDNTAVPDSVIAAAKSLQFHVSCTLEDATTKDTVGDWQVQEITGINYDISSGALVRSGETITSGVGGHDLASIEEIYEASQPVRFQIANVSGANNRTKDTILVSGSVVITQLAINGPNRQNADYTTTLTGYGNFTVGR